MFLSGRGLYTRKDPATPPKLAACSGHAIRLHGRGWAARAAAEVLLADRAHFSPPRRRTSSP